MATMATRTFSETRERPVPTIALTDLTVRNLKPVPGKRVTYLDKSIKGFGVRITENGVKSFVLTYGDDRKRVKLGDVGILALKDAREKAKDILAKRQLNPASDTPSIAFDDALRTYLKSYATKNRPATVYETERLLNKHLVPTFTGKPLGDVKKAKLVELLDDIESISVRRHFYAAAYTFFRWARRYDLPNPLDGVERPHKGPSRARLLTEPEFLKVWHESLALGTYGLLYRVLLVSGQRRRQISHLHADFIDREKRVITWPAHLMKTNKDFILPYGDLLHSLLPQGEGLLFPADDGTPWKTWIDPHLDLLKRCGIPHFTRHDCRRFYSSTHGAIGTPPHIRELLLSHAFGSEVSQTYDRYGYAHEKRLAQVSYENHLTSLLNTPR